MKILLFFSPSLWQQWPPKASVVAAVAGPNLQFVTEVNAANQAGSSLITRPHGPCLADRWWFFLSSAVDLLFSGADPGTWWFWWRHHVIVIIEGGLYLLTWRGSPPLLSKGASEILSWCLTAQWTSDNLTFSSSARTSPPLPRLLHPQLNAWLFTPGSVPPLSSPFCFVSNNKKGWIVLFPWPPSSPRRLPFSFHIRQLSSFIHSTFTSSACH